MASLLKTDSGTNIGEMERWVSLIGGLGLIAYGALRRDKAGAGLAALGGGLAWRGAYGHCELYTKLGIDTAPRGYAKGTGSDKGVPYQLGIRVDQEVRIAKPVEEVYRFWRKLENLSRFMNNLESVKQTGEGTSHWVAKGLGGIKFEWDAEIVNDIENQVIGWRSLPGSQVASGGSVRFEDSGDGSTVVRVSLQYNPPAGRVGATIARAFGDDPQRTIREDLERLKELLETGATTTKRTTGDEQDRWQRTGKKKEDCISNAGEESFPASDSPSWTPAAL